VPLSPLRAFLGLYALILRITRRTVRRTDTMAPARTPRAATPVNKALWSATQKTLATPRAGTPQQRTEGGPVTSSTYYPRFPAVDGLLDLLFQYGLPASSIHTRTQHGRVTLSVALPHGTYTDEYTASSIQGAARNWLNGEADEFHELLILDAQTHARAAA
jgi:hypothetical protein